MTLEHHLVVAPGLGNEIYLHQKVMGEWNRSGIIPHIFEPNWKIEEPELQPKINRAIKLVDQLSSEGKTVSVMGNSASSSFVLNVYGQRKDNIHKVIINCGRVRTGDWPWFTFDQATALSPSFKQSVLESEKVIASLSKKDLSKIATYRPLFDEIVPPFTVPIEGAHNNVIPSVEHGFSIFLIMTLFRARLIQWIKE